MTTFKSKANYPATPLKKNSKTSIQSIASLVLMGLLVPLIIIEAAAYFFPGSIPQEIKSTFRDPQNQPLKGLIPDKRLGYKYAPGLVDFVVPFEGDTGPDRYMVSTVSLGYPDIGFRDDGLEGESFAVVIGDSYTSCASVALQHCWVELLEQKTGLDWANLGVVGYSPQQEARMLADYGLPLHPELVLWVFFPNDLDDAWRFEHFGSGAAQEGTFWRNPLWAWLAQNSTVYNIGAFFWYNRALFYNLATTSNSNAPLTTNLVWWLTHTDLTNPEVSHGLTLTQQAILEAHRQTIAAQNHTQFVVLIFPSREQVYAQAHFQPRLDQLNQAMTNFCQRQELTCIDLTSSLRTQTRHEAEAIYFQKDIHLNERGNEITTELLVDLLSPYWQ